MRHAKINKTALFPCLLLGMVLLGWTSLSKEAADRMRAFSVGALTPAWRSAEKVKDSLSKNSKAESEEISRLKLENQRLKNQLSWAKEWVLYDAELKTEREAYLSSLLEKRRRSIPASVVYRDPSTWSSILWIDAGEEDNERIGFDLIARNSPVAFGDSLIGVIDYVGKKQSRVRLITDSGLSPAVRVERVEPNKKLNALIDALCQELKAKEGLFEFVNQLQALKEKSQEAPVYLAKGQLQGDGAPFWRSDNPVLKGVGFNYDYSDAYGPARDLRGGRPIGCAGKEIPLIQKGDKLVTSGLDGVFPFGLSVAIVTKVFPLEEGSFSYEIEAIPTAPSLDDLKVVFVLAPLE